MALYLASGKWYHKNCRSNFRRFSTMASYFGKLSIRNSNEGYRWRISRNQWKHLVENGFVWQFCRKWHRFARLNKNPRGAVRGLTNIENRTQFFLSSIGSAFQYIFITGVRCTWTSWMLSTNVGEWITQRVLYGNQNITNNISKGYFVIPAKISFNFSYFSQNFLHDSNCLDGETIPTENADGICSNCPSRFWIFW